VDRRSGPEEFVDSKLGKREQEARRTIQFGDLNDPLLRGRVNPSREREKREVDITRIWILP
jgi:hypothetical protein